ncbi:MAG: M48 family metallopeptidase [Rhizomicrobium sp.]|jgi:Zn-dependent protease with chaperone function
MLDGRYFFPHSARFVEARAAIVGGKTLRVENRDAIMLDEVPFKKVRVSARLGRIARRFELPNGGRFETDDNDGADEMLRAARHVSGQGWVDRLERSWRTVALSVLLAGAAGYAFVVYGIPAMAAELAQHTPSGISIMMADQTMAALDGVYLKPSKLAAKDRKKAQALFDRIAAHEPRGKGGYHLLFRGGGIIGPNAFALPDGRIVMTDELWAMVKNDDEIEGVFAHEMAHVTRAHGLQRVYEASLVPATIAVVTGDVSQVSQMSVILPGILVQSAYSREFEQQADDDGAKLLLSIGGHPARMADLLQRMDRKICGKTGCGPSWLGSHPQTSVRVERLRAEDPPRKK